MEEEMVGALAFASPSHHHRGQSPALLGVAEPMESGECTVIPCWHTGPLIYLLN